MTTRPVIGIITNLDPDPHYQFPGYQRVSLNDDYPRAVALGGGVPVLIAPSAERSLLADQLSLVDGLVLAGGPDVDPLAYGQDPQALCGVPSPVRDAFEFEALRLAREAGMPVLGICRGLQVANVFCGGTLFQDMSYAGTTQKHAAGGNPSLPAHRITIEPKSFLDEAWGVRTARVNSFHHQAIDQLGTGLEVVARAADGTIEAVEYTGDDFDLVGVQWHPEMMAATNQQARSLFTWFVDVVAGRWEE